MRIVITGATGFIGFALLKHLGKKHSVTAVVRNPKKMLQLQKTAEIKNLNIVKTDLNQEKSVKRLFESLENLDVLINCAAILGPVGKLRDNDLGEWKNTITVNLLGTVYSSYYALELLLRSKRGKIINFAGGGAANARSHHTAYASSKTAVLRFTETLALEYPQLQVNAVAPGAHLSQLWDQESYDPKPQQWGDLNKLLNFIDFLLSKKTEKVSGKFLHYLDKPEKIINSQASNLFTLRRVE